jgi:hypothetical protein
METVLAGLQWDICLIYLDDVIVLGRSFEESSVENQQLPDKWPNESSMRGNG